MIDGPSNAVGRRFYALAALGLALFIGYGSLVPLSFHPLGFSQALTRFVHGLDLTIHPDSNTDFATNVLLGIPLGYFLLGALCTDRGGLPGRLLSGLLSIAGCGAVATLVEFAQTFFPGRTPSFSDIAAQAIGGSAGVAAWLVVGDQVTEWLRMFAVERGRVALAHQLLLAYCVIFAASQLVPLDLTISLGELARKYRRGGIIVIPFSYAHATWLEALWDYIGDVVLHVPVGAAAALLWTRERAARSLAAGLAIAVTAIGAIELGQVFVSSRYADVTDVLTGSAGAFIGMLLARRYSSPVGAASRLGGDVSFSENAARAGVCLWILALLSYHWNPFDFTTAADRVALGMRQLLMAPFSSYYFGAPFHAFTEMTRKALLALPLGVLLRLSWRQASHPSWAQLQRVLLGGLGLAVLAAIEVGQVFLPSRTPDMTDVFIGELGLLAGLVLTGRIAAARHDVAGRAPADATLGSSPGSEPLRAGEAQR